MNNLKIPKTYSNGIRETEDRYQIPHQYNLINHQAIDFDDNILENTTQLQITNPLPPNLDVFSNLPLDILKKQEVTKFFKGFRQILLNNQDRLSEINLPKLSVSENDEETVQFDWIFNFFRIYFAFYKTEGMFCGLVINDTNTQSFENKFWKVKNTQYDVAAQWAVNIVITTMGV